MTLPNTDKPLPDASGEQKPPDGDQETEDRGSVGEPIGPVPLEVCPPSVETRRPSSILRHLPSALRSPRSLLWLGGGATAMLGLVGVIILLRGCEGRITVRPTPQMEHRIPVLGPCAAAAQRQRVYCRSPVSVSAHSDGAYAGPSGQRAGAGPASRTGEDQPC